MHDSGSGRSDEKERKGANVRSEQQVQGCNRNEKGVTAMGSVARSRTVVSWNGAHIPVAIKAYLWPLLLCIKTSVNLVMRVAGHLNAVCTEGRGPRIEVVLKNTS